MRKVFFLKFFGWPLSIHTVTFCITEIRGRLKAWFDALYAESILRKKKWNFTHFKQVYISWNTIYKDKMYIHYLNLYIIMIFKREKNWGLRRIIFLFFAFLTLKVKRNSPISLRKWKYFQKYLWVLIRGLSTIASWKRPELKNLMLLSL